MISPKSLKSENSIEIHKILKFHKISLKSEKHTAGAYDFPQIHKMVNEVWGNLQIPKIPQIPQRSPLRLLPDASGRKAASCTA